jgi:hypothetical protein
VVGEYEEVEEEEERDNHSRIPYLGKIFEVWIFPIAHKKDADRLAIIYL